MYKLINLRAYLLSFLPMQTHNGASTWHDMATELR